jgi:hypothetical protein
VLGSGAGWAAVVVVGAGPPVVVVTSVVGVTSSGWEPRLVVTAGEPGPRPAVVAAASIRRATRVSADGLVLPVVPGLLEAELAGSLEPVSALVSPADAAGYGPAPVAGGGWPLKALRTATVNQAVPTSTQASTTPTATDPKRCARVDRFPPPGARWRGTTSDIADQPYPMG